MALATYFRFGAKSSFTLRRGPRSLAGQFSLIIPNASMHVPPTSSAVLLNFGMSMEPAAHGLPLLTE